MKHTKLIKIILLTFLGIIGFGFCLLILPWLLIFLGIYLSPNPPEPVNTYGKFLFRLEYEIDGKGYTVEDALICEYIGIAMDEGSGKHLKWDVTLANDGDALARSYESAFDNLLFGYRLFTGIIEGQGSVSIYCDIGNPQYYLGYKNYADYAPGRVRISSPGYNGIIREDELFSEYGIKVISAEFSEPLKGNGIEETSEYHDVARSAAKGVTSTPELPLYPIGTTQIIFTWENATDKTMECGQSFYIQKQTEGEWCDIYREYAAHFPEREKVHLEPHTQFTYICNIGIFITDIPAGKYRAVSYVEVPIAERSYEAKVLCGEFVIE